MFFLHVFYTALCWDVPVRCLILETFVQQAQSRAMGHVLTAYCRAALAAGTGLSDWNQRMAMKKLAVGMRDDCFCWTTAPGGDLLVWSRQLLLGHRLSSAFPGADRQGHRSTVFYPLRVSLEVY